jgi:Ca2+-transporting ATPase
VAIFVAVAIIVSVTAVNNYMRDKQFRNLNSKREQRVVPVLRNGKIEDLNIYHLLVGDIMQVNVGEQFPVDGILLKGFSKGLGRVLG